MWPNNTQISKRQTIHYFSIANIFVPMNLATYMGGAHPTNIDILYELPPSQNVKRWVIELVPVVYWQRIAAPSIRIKTELNGFMGEIIRNGNSTIEGYGGGKYVLLADAPLSTVQLKNLFFGGSFSSSDFANTGLVTLNPADAGNYVVNMAAYFYGHPSN